MTKKPVPAKRLPGERPDPPVEGEDVRRVLYRCPTRTNFLCPCGAAERRLKKLGLEHRVERVPYGRAKRPEIEDLTGQVRVPVLVDGEEVINDSRRILQYLEWRYPLSKEDEPKAP